MFYTYKNLQFSTFLETMQKTSYGLEYQNYFASDRINIYDNSDNPRKKFNYIIRGVIK